jgi:hypothetical protein
MKLRATLNPSRRTGGIALIECLVYIGVMAVVFGMGTAAYFSSLEHTAALRRNTDDITRALTAGEYWRADIRAATQPPRFDETAQTLHVPQAKGEVAYKFSEDQVFRRGSADALWMVVMPRVQQSEMIRDVRAQVTAWRWELELKSTRRQAMVRPLFTFITTPDRP